MGERDNELTPLQHTERSAMVGDRAAVLRLVSALRRYRAASARLLDARYTDGECDAVALSDFAHEIADIEDSHGGDHASDLLLMQPVAKNHD